MNEAAYEEIHGKLLNWARWLPGGADPMSHCASIEHLYVPEKLTEAMQAQVTDKNAEPPIDHVDGESMDIALRACKIMTRQFLKAWYYSRSAPGKLSRRFSLEMEGLDQHRRACLAEARIQFTTVNRIRRNRTPLYHERCTITPSSALPLANHKMMCNTPPQITDPSPTWKDLPMGGSVRPEKTESPA